jgi:hypothetical protein
LDTSTSLSLELFSNVIHFPSGVQSSTIEDRFQLIQFKYILIAIGPFLIFLLKTLPSSLPNDGGAGSGDETCSTFC